MTAELETCWHLSPPWRDRTPPLYFQIKERVLIVEYGLTGWVCGAAWNPSEYNWDYSIATPKSYYRKQESQMRSCNRLQIVRISRKSAELGEIVTIRPIGRRIVQGILWNGDRWLYAVERNIPTLDPQKGGRFDWYSSESIVNLEAML